jgi:hypothetical protein
MGMMGMFSGGMQMAGFGLNAISTGMSAAAAYRQQEAQNQANKLNAASYEQNAQLARIQAETARQFGEQEYKDTVKEYGELRGAQRAAYGASGVDVNSGSAAAVQANTAAEGIYAGEKAKYQRDLQAWQLEQDAAGMDFEAAKARAGVVNPLIPGASAAIGGLTSMYSTYGQWRP